MTVSSDKTIRANFARIVVLRPWRPQVCTSIWNESHLNERLERQAVAALRRRVTPASAETHAAAYARSTQSARDTADEPESAANRTKTMRWWHPTLRRQFASMLRIRLERTEVSMICELRRSLLVFLSALIGVTSLTSPAAAQAAPEPPPFSIRVLGEATVTAQPDQVEIDIGVTTQADTAQRAAANNADRTNRVVAELETRVGTDGTIATVSYSVQPEYAYPREGREPQIAGYAATNVVRVTSPRLEKIGDLIDAAVKAGANRVHRIEFGLREEDSVHARALQQAARRARAEAEALASALGLRIGRVLSAVEAATPHVVRDGFAPAALRAEAAPTPVRPAAIEVDGKVWLTVEVTASNP